METFRLSNYRLPYEKTNICSRNIKIAKSFRVGALPSLYISTSIVYNKIEIIEYPLPCKFVKYNKELSYPPSISSNSNIEPLLWPIVIGWTDIKPIVAYLHRRLFVYDKLFSSVTYDTHDAWPMNYFCQNESHAPKARNYHRLHNENILNYNIYL